MSTFRYLIVFSLLAVSAGMARADGLLYNLPKDGTWAAYDIAMSLKFGDRTSSVKGTLRIASVGRATEENQPCRWIEVQFDTEMTTGDHKEKESDTSKLLIPERYLAKGESPLKHVLRAWQQRNQGEPRKADLAKDIDSSPLQIILSGPGTDVKQLGIADVESKLGKLACEGVEGTLELITKPEGTAKCKLHNRLHSDSPFGVVAGHWMIEGSARGGQAVTVEWNLKLSDFGENATSKMPDAK